MPRIHWLRTLQKFIAMHGAVDNHFNLQRHLTSRRTCKINRTAALAAWRRLLA